MKSSHTFPQSNLFYIGALVLVTLPGYALAAPFGSFKDVIDYILAIIWILIPIFVTLAFLGFFWGLSKFILNPGNTAEIENGKKYMMWGVLALFILLSFRSIIGLVFNELELGGSGYRYSNGQTYPLLPTGGQVNNSYSTVSYPSIDP